MFEKVVPFVFFVLISSVVFAAEEKEPVMLEAESIVYNQEEAIAIAKGNVEVVQGQRILLADEIIYFKNADLLKASGNISLLEPSGEVLFAKKAELRDSLKLGVINSFSARFNDNSLMAAESAEKLSPSKTVLNYAVYSPCPVCKNRRVTEPQWQIKAKKVTHDENEQRIYYNHAFFEVYGVPIAYTPYLSHASPGAKRKSGFLIPSYTNSGRLGNVIKIPYYYNIAPNKDVVLSPIVTTEAGTVLQADYRHLIESGNYRIRTSFTDSNDRNERGVEVDGTHKFRGHIEGEGRFAINDAWQWGFNAKRVTDDTYLRKYGFGSEDILTSRLFLEKVQGRDYITIENLTFQGLNEEDDPAASPVVTPLVNSHKEYEYIKGTKLFVDSNILILSRGEGIQSRRVSVAGGFKKSHITTNGQILGFNTSLRGDAYVVDHVPILSRGSEKYSGFVSRAIPQAELLWRYPLMQHNFAGNFFIEPIVKFIVSPYGGNPEKIPNEDSQDIEFSDENLFSANRFSGLDRVESGTRTSYGVRGGLHSFAGSEINYLIGQSYKMKEDNNFSEKSGLNDNLSNFVGRVAYRAAEVFDLSYQFRLNKDNFTAHKNVVRTKVNVSPFSLSSSYIRFDENTAIENFDNAGSIVDNSNVSREFLNSTIDMLLIDDWSLGVDGHRDLDNGKWISAGTHLKYDGICTDFIFSVSRDFTSDREGEASTSFSFTVSLKNLN